MSEEEKKAIEEIKKDEEYYDILHYIQENEYDMWNVEKLMRDSTNGNYTRYEIAESIVYFINQIEKQQKEIENLKDLYSDEKIRNTIIKRYREVIEKDYISKDNIKEKIKEYETTLNENLFTKIQIIEHGFPKENIIQIMIKAKVEILKELLEE